MIEYSASRRGPGQTPPHPRPKGTGPEPAAMAQIEGRLVGSEGGVIVHILHLDVRTTDQVEQQHLLATMTNHRVLVTVTLVGE